MTDQLTFGDIKKMDYAEEMPFKWVLVDLLYRKFIDVNDVLTCYTNAIEKERDLSAMRFNEACANLTQLVCGNYHGKDKQEAIKRSLHTLNICKAFPPHIYDTMYGYTDEDEKRFDEFCKTIYGTNLKA